MGYYFLQGFSRNQLHQLQRIRGSAIVPSLKAQKMKALIRICYRKHLLAQTKP